MPRIVEHPAFTVIGITARTSNAQETGGTGVIGARWGRFFQEGLLAKIPNRSDSNIVAVYTDYESDARGDYTFLLGARVSLTDDPPGMEARTIPAGQYCVFTSELGELSKVVPDTWAKVWRATEETLGGRRSFVADFEIYDERASDPRNGQVDLYVGIS